MSGSPAPQRSEHGLPVEEQADRAADLEVERRTRITAGVWVILALGFRFSPAPTPGFVHLMSGALAAMIFCLGVRIGAYVYARDLAVGSTRRRVVVGVPFLAQVAVWTAFTTVALMQTQGTWFPPMAMLVQCLGAASAVVSYSARAPLAAAIVGILVVPPGVVLVALGDAPTRTMGAFALVYAALNWTVLPRLARERRSSMLSMALLQDRARSLEEARDATLAAASAKDAFFANLSHEIRTPLHGLLGIVEALRATPLTAEQGTAVEHLHRSGHALLATLNDALDSARLESGQLQLRPEPFSLPDLIRDVVELFAEEARRKGISLSLRTPGALPAQVIGDPQRIRQVLQNLIGNAVKFTAAGSVVVEARTTPTDRAGVELSVEVTDTGVGFDARESARLFQRFSQLSDGRRGGGTGLGLAISADLVRLMGGEIDGSSPGRGQGAVFSVQIPLVLGAPVSAALRGRRVLVVDDNAVNLAVAHGYLEALGVQVEQATGGDDALVAAGRQTFDAILMDCQMPGRDGLAATQALRARGDRTPVIAVTAADDEHTRQRCLEAGMDGIVHKPVSPEALHAALTRLL